MPRELSPELLERVRSQLQNDKKAQARHRDFQEAMGVQPTPYKADEMLVRMYAQQIATEEERQRLMGELAAERAEVNALYEAYGLVRQGEPRRQEIAVKIIPKLEGRIKDLAARAGVVGGHGSCPCMQSGDKVEDLHTDMTCLEAIIVQQTLRHF